MNINTITSIEENGKDAAAAAAATTEDSNIVHSQPKKVAPMMLLKDRECIRKNDQLVKKERVLKMCFIRSNMIISFDGSNVLHLWDLETKLFSLKEFDCTLYSCFASPDGQWMLIGGTEGFLGLFDTSFTDGPVINEIQRATKIENSYHVSCIAHHQDQVWCGTTTGSVHLFRYPELQQLARCQFNLIGGVKALAVGSDLVVVGLTDWVGSGSASVLNSRTREEILIFKEHPDTTNNLYLLDSGLVVSRGSNTLLAWNPNDGKVMDRWELPRYGTPWNFTIESMCISYDMSLLAVGAGVIKDGRNMTYPNTLYLLSLPGFEIKTSFPQLHSQIIRELCFSPCSAHLASASDDGTIQVLEFV
jgi:WD40 repeat protein